jgi:hypothetical protein
LSVLAWHKTIPPSRRVRELDHPRAANVHAALDAGGALDHPAVGEHGEECTVGELVCNKKKREASFPSFFYLSLFLAPFYLLPCPIPVTLGRVRDAVMNSLET